VGQLEVVEEDRIEVDCETALLDNVLRAIRNSHPYEHPGIDIYPLMSFVMPPKQQGQSS
jgi:hypothetical protein